MQQLRGFAISGYRTLSGAAQWIPLDASVTVFLGGNNSGKSNILRLLDQHMGHLFASMQSGSNVTAFDPRLDAPRDDGDQGLEIYWPFNAAGLSDSQQLARFRQDLEPVFELLQFGEHGATLPFTSRSLNEPLEISLQTAQKIMESSASAINWANMSSALTSMSGGEQGADTHRVLMKFREWLVPPPETVLVPPSRNVTRGDNSEDWDFSGAGMIHQLQRLKAPAFDENVLRERAEALTRDLRILLEDDRLEFQVPSDASTVNIMLGGRWFPLQSLGTGTEHAVVILAARHVYPDKLLCLEEPDAHLHPRLQRRLVSLLRDSEGRQLAVATHSAHMIDAADTAVAVRLEDARSSITVVGDHTLFDALRLLGYRASDLLQTNCIVWMEGPADRIYLLHWLRAIAPDLVEGVDFSIAFYGGALLARLSAAGEEQHDPTLVDLWRINRRMWVVMDSDQGDGELKPAVRRLRDEVEAAGTGGTWITNGYTIENYIDHALLVEAVREVHPTVEEISGESSDQDPLANLLGKNDQSLKRVDKVAIAVAVCGRPANLDVLDLRARVSEVAGFIRHTPTDELAPVVAPSDVGSDE